MGLTKSQKAVLHIAKGQLGLDDDSYRDALEAYGGVRSSVDLDYKGYKAVMAHFEKCGFKRKGGSRAPARKKTRPGMATDKQIKKIYALWWSLGGAYYDRGRELKALRGFLKKRFGVDHEQFLEFPKAIDVIEGIKAIAERTV